MHRLFAPETVEKAMEFPFVPLPERTPLAFSRRTAIKWATKQKMPQHLCCRSRADQPNKSQTEINYEVLQRLMMIPVGIRKARHAAVCCSMDRSMDF
jgi:hypothetical protein